MDKRTLLFVILVGMVFVGMNFYFSSQRDKKNRQLIQQQAVKKEQETLSKKADIEKRAAKLKDLPLIDLYFSPQKVERASYGINVEGNTLTLAWDDDMPEILYADQLAQRRVTENPVKGGPVVYAKKDFKFLSITRVPNVGIYDIQLVTFPPDGAQPKIYLGEMGNGMFTTISGPMFENAIALYKTPQGWLPFAFYEAKGNMLIELQDLPLLSGLVQGQTPAISSQEKKSQQFFLLENEYVQLVFSNVGGALAEINLPFKSSSHPLSVVKEIGFDRTIAADYPANAHFPAHPYFAPGSSQEHSEGKVGGYYPLLRRGIWNKNTVEIPPQYYALNLVSDYPEMAELVYDVKEFTSSKIIFEAVQPHRKITKTFTLNPGSKGAPYIFNLDVQVEGDSRGLFLTSGIPEVEIMSNSSSPQIQYKINRKGKTEVEKLDLPKAKEMVSVSSTSPEWVVNSNGYLGVILDPLKESSSGFRATAIAGTKVPTRLSVIDPKYHPYPASKYPGYEILFPLTNRGGTWHFRIFSGPFEEGVLKAVDEIYADPEAGYNPDYIASRTFYGWFSFISKPFAKLLFIVMSFFHTLTGSWGLSIILLTLFLRLLLYPLNAWSIKSMRRLQQLSPQIQEIQKKYKKEPKKAQMEIMALYREKKANPFTGCIPMLIQIPFLIAMFDLLKSSFQLRGASFIPGWIDNLTAPDVLFQWQTPIFFIGNQFHLLPILLGAVMFIQQKLASTGPKDPKQMTDQQRQQKAMGTIMTIVFTVMFYHFPSGLNLYWLSSMLLGILQQWITNKILDRKKKSATIIAPEKGKKAVDMK